MTYNRHCPSYSAQPKGDNNSVTYWEWSTFPLENAMNNSLLPGEEKNLPQGYWTKSSFLSSLEKKVYKVLSAFCILCHWSSDNWLCLVGSQLDMLRLSSGKRFSSKLSLPSQGTGSDKDSLTSKDRVKFKLHCRKFHSEVLSQFASLHTTISFFKGQNRRTSFFYIYDYKLYFMSLTDTLK